MAVIFCQLNNKKEHMKLEPVIVYKGKPKYLDFIDRVLKVSVYQLFSKPKEVTLIKDAHTEDFIDYESKPYEKTSKAKAIALVIVGSPFFAFLLLCKACSKEHRTIVKKFKHIKQNSKNDSLNQKVEQPSEELRHSQTMSQEPVSPTSGGLLGFFKGFLPSTAQQPVNNAEIVAMAQGFTKLGEPQPINN